MNSKKVIWIIVILFLVGLAIYLFSWGQINIISDAEHSNQLKRKQAEDRLKELEPEMEKDLTLKRKLDRYVLWGFIGAKIVIVAALFGICIFVKYLFKLSWGDLYEWKDKAGFCLTICVFFVFGAEIKFLKAYPMMRAIVRSWVYRKYGHLDKQIEYRAAEIAKLKEVLATIPEPTATSAKLIVDNSVLPKKGT